VRGSWRSGAAPVTDSWDDTRSMADLIGAFVNGLDQRDRQRMREAGVLAWWKASIPVEIERHTRVAGIRDGEMLVEVDSATWATELSALSGRLQDMIEESAGKGAVRSLRFTVSRRVAMSRDAERQDEELDRLYSSEGVAPVPLTPQERAQVEHAAEQIADVELRQAFIEAMVTDMELEKGRKAASAPQKGSQKPTG
jgi:Dna[CI] antecedent, DciA